MLHHGGGKRLALNAGAKRARRNRRMDKLVYGDYSVDFDSLPAVSQAALALRGLTHLLGNEVSSKVLNWSGQEGQANSDDKATIKAWKEANADAVKAKGVEFANDMLQSLADGTLGNRVGGPRLTPIETLKRQIAKGQIETILRAAKIKVPTKDDTVKTPDGEFTMAQLVDRRLVATVKDASGNVTRDIGAEIQKEADKELAARAKKQAAIIADAGGLAAL